MTTQLMGIHQLTAITANVSANHDLYTRVLGLRMVKKMRSIKSMLALVISSMPVVARSQHHVFQLADPTWKAWASERIEDIVSRASASLDGGVLFKIATDGSGFDADEPEEALGKRLALSLFLEARRAEIEAGLKPI